MKTSRAIIFYIEIILYERFENICKPKVHLLVSKSFIFTYQSYLVHYFFFFLKLSINFNYMFVIYFKVSFQESKRHKHYWIYYLMFVHCKLNISKKKKKHRTLHLTFFSRIFVSCKMAF